jgi:hypothetical protein
MVPFGARAEGKTSPAERYEAVLDIDRDGKMDRAVLVSHPEGAGADLLIYLGAGSEAPDLSRKAERPTAKTHCWFITAAAGAATTTRPR